MLIVGPIGSQSSLVRERARRPPARDNQHTDTSRLEHALKFTVDFNNILNFTYFLSSFHCKISRNAYLPHEQFDTLFSFIHAS